MRLRHKPWADELISAHKDIALEREDLARLPSFSYLEIGSGRGGFLIRKAEAEPQHSFLGAEVARAAFAIAVKKLLSEEKAPSNIRFINIPADELLRILPDGGLQEIYLNFSDPWPKKRQQKRRLTFPAMLAMYHRVLAPGGLLIFKTDQDGLYEDSLRYFASFGGFAYHGTADYKGDLPGDQMSEYELKFRAAGVPIHLIEAVKEN